MNTEISHLTANAAVLLGEADKQMKGGPGRRSAPAGLKWSGGPDGD
jgi:hypothetical protein